MLNLLLNIVGITLILYSIYIIKKDLGRKNISEEKSIEFYNPEVEYYETTEDSIDEFDQLIDAKIQMSKIKTSLNKKELNIDEINENANSIIQEKETISEDNYTNPLHKKIIELKSIGLTNEDIAKKLGRGIREIDIILKMYKR